MRRLLDPNVRFHVALVVLLVCLVCWPASALWWAKDEPQFVLHLSWAAIVLTILDWLTTSDVRREQAS
jgi:hypothetical protein